MNHVRIAAVVAAAFGCGCEGERQANVAILRDSADVRIAENPGYFQQVPGWFLDSLPTLRLGREDGVGPDVFSRIRHVIRLRSGSIAVADAGSREVRLFDVDGRYLLTFGGPGEGPGEFSTLWMIAEAPGDSIAAVDGLGGRVSVFGSGGQFSRVFPLPRISGGSAPNVVGWLRDGHLVVSTQQLLHSGEMPTQSRIFIYTVDREGQVSNQLGPYTDRELGRNGLGLGFGAHAELAVGDSLIWYGQSGRYELLALNRVGSVRRIVRMRRAPQAVTEADIVEAQAFVKQDLARQGATGPAVQRILATEYASTYPVHGKVVVDVTGNLWVEHFKSHLLGGDGAQDWDIFDPDGRLLGSIAVPPGLRITQIGEDYLLGVYTDSLGVESVHLYRLAKDQH